MIKFTIASIILVFTLQINGNATIKRSKKSTISRETKVVLDNLDNTKLGYKSIEPIESNILQNSITKEQFASKYQYGGYYRDENRNVLAIGYQIGGFSMIGFNYEIRIHDYIGIHFGAGYLGYTAGVKIHTNYEKNSSFFNISLKDGGFGHIRTYGVEYGRRWVWNNNNDFGLHYQIGIAVIDEISDKLAEKVYDDKPVPDVMLSAGIGFSW